MNLDQKIASFLAAAEAVPARSKLEAYAELIRSLRRKRWTFQRIAQALRDEFGMSVAPSTLHNFLKVRAKQNGGAAMAPPEMNSPTAAAAMPLAKPKRRRFHLDP